MTKEVITQDYLKSILSYDPETGIFIWLKSTGTSKKGSIAGGKDEKGYIRIYINKKGYRAHRLAFLYMNGSLPFDQVDHKNHIKNDNRFKNLRECSNKENHKNRTLNANNKSGIVGVHWKPSIKKWVAQISNNDKREHLGFYKERNHAIMARWLAEDKYKYHENHGR